MLKFRNVRGRCLPYVTCDCCGGRLVEVTDASVIYRVTEPGCGEGGGDVLFAHKAACLDTLQHQLGCNFGGRQELFRYLSYLTFNVKLMPTDIVQALALDARTAA